MNNFVIGDVVGRKSYGGDVSFKVSRIVNNRDNNKPVYVLKGLLYRLEADSEEEDLIKQNPRDVFINSRKELTRARQRQFGERSLAFLPFFARLRTRPGKVLHIDGDGDFLNKCADLYREAGVRIVGKAAAESEQPGLVRQLLKKYKPDILVITGHDGIKKGAKNYNSLDSYRNSQYFVQSVKEARKYESNPDKLCIFAGACQSYYEAIMQSGSNFASSPGRILINALDPAIVGRKIAITDSKVIVAPQDVIKLTVSGAEGIGGINTKGHLVTM